tara:strand:- start:1786 stop:1908 length:123 start_codon:yes stop_codon:yes gene_type:complete
MMSPFYKLRFRDVVTHPIVIGLVVFVVAHYFIFGKKENIE